MHAAGFARMVIREEVNKIVRSKVSAESTWKTGGRSTIARGQFWVGVGLNE